MRKNGKTQLPSHTLALSLSPLTNLSKQDKTWVEFASLAVPVRQGSALLAQQKNSPT
jgi:hypothetical protein